MKKRRMQQTDWQDQLPVNETSGGIFSAFASIVAKVYGREEDRRPEGIESGMRRVTGFSAPSIPGPD